MLINTSSVEQQFKFQRQSLSFHTNKSFYAWVLFFVYFDSKDKKQAVIVECKKMTANYKENGSSILQLFKYAKHLYDSGIIEIYLVLPVNIDKDFRDILESQQHFCKVFSHKGELWQNSYNDRNSYIQVITQDALIASAQARNKKFI